jgi:hypothetical protein
MSARWGKLLWSALAFAVRLTSAIWSQLLPQNSSRPAHVPGGLLRQIGLLRTSPASHAPLVNGALSPPSWPPGCPFVCPPTQPPAQPALPRTHLICFRIHLLKCPSLTQLLIHLLVNSHAPCSRQHTATPEECCGQESLGPGTVGEAVNGLSLRNLGRAECLRLALNTTPSPPTHPAVYCRRQQWTGSSAWCSGGGRGPAGRHAT